MPSSHALTLEALLPAAMASLFRGSSDNDPLRHLSLSQIRLMRALSGGEQTASQLSQSLQMSPSALTQMAGRLILAGLVRKETGEDDRRVRKLALTPHGQELMAERRTTRAGRADAVLKNFPAAKTKELIALLNEVVALNKPGSDIAEVLV
jgi:DNA-binding MarR family transcriptional regulator